jgi:hypothetical protein
MHVSAMLGLFVMMFLGLNCDILCLYFYKSPFYYHYSAHLFSDLTSIFLDYSWQNLVGLFVQNHVCNQFPAQGPSED